MFKRALVSAYTCPQCRRIRSLRDSKHAVDYIHKRWQNSAARTAQTDIDNIDEEVENNSEVRYPQSTTRYRHWSPKPTARLGVDALGQPAEVLILPKSRRKSTNFEFNEQTDGGDEGVVPKAPLSEPPILETLAGESKLPSTDEISQHMEAIKSKFKKSQGRIHPNEWARMRTALAHSFSAKQLVQYHEAETGKRKEVQSRVWKTSLAESIMKDVWKYTDPSKRQQDEVALNHEQDPFKQVQRIYMTERVKLFMLNEKRLRKIHVIEPDVEMTQNARGRLLFSGPAHAVERTMKLLRAHESKVVLLHLPIPTQYEDMSKKWRLHPVETHQSSNDIKQLKDLTLRSGVELRAGDDQGSSTKIYGIDDTHIKTFLQHLMLWIERVNSETATLPLSSYNATDLCDIPLAVDDLYQTASLWQRYVLKRPTGSKSIHKPSIVSDDLGEHLKSTFLKASAAPENSLLNLALFNSDTYHDSKYSARIGLTVFQQQDDTIERSSDINSNKNKLEDEVVNYSVGEGSHTTSLGEGEEKLLEETARTESNSPTPTITTIMVTHIPLLAQFLAQQSPLIPAPNQIPSYQLETVEPETLVHLIYRCPDARYPSVEIYASVSKSKMEVRRIACLLDSVQRYLALPNLVADLKVDKTTSVPLYQYGVPLETRFVPFIATLARALNSTSKDETGKVTGIDPLIHLDLSPLSTRTGADSQGLVSGEKPALEERSMKKVLYILSTAEQVEHATYKTPVKSPFALEHLVFIPLRDVPDQTPKQVLRIVEKPLLWQPLTEPHVSRSREDVNGISTEQQWTPQAIGLDEERFEAFLKTAQRSVMAFDRFTNDRSRLVVEANTQVEKPQKTDLAQHPTLHAVNQI